MTPRGRKITEIRLEADPRDVMPNKHDLQNSVVVYTGTVLIASRKVGVGENVPKRDWIAHPQLPEMREQIEFWNQLVWSLPV